MSQQFCKADTNTLDWRNTGELEEPHCEQRVNIFDSWFEVQNAEKKYKMNLANS